MDLTPYVETLRDELGVAPETGRSALQLTLLEVLSAAADEITRELAPGSVEVRLRSGEPEFVVTPPPSDEPTERAPGSAPPVPAEGDEGAIARINLRLPEHLKAGVDEAAARERMSANGWLVRAVANALAQQARDRHPSQRGGRIGESFTGWVQ